MRVLIVEDDVTQASAMAATLRRRGFVVFVALSLAETMSLLDETPVDAAICDYIVPDIRGTELTQLFTAIKVPHLYYTCDADAPVSVLKIVKPNFQAVVDWLNALAEKKGGAKMSGMIGDVVEYTRSQEEHLVLLQTVKAMRKVVDELTHGDAITARDSAGDLLATLESRLDYLDERRNRPKETP